MSVEGGRRLMLRLALLSLILVLPFCYWSAWEDCFPLAKWLGLSAFGGLAVVVAGRLSPPFTWVPWWGIWSMAGIANAGSSAWWRAVPEAVLLVLPPLAAAVGTPSGDVRRALKIAVAVELAGVAVSVWALVQFLGMEPGSWLSPFHKGVSSTIGNPDLLGGVLLVPFAAAFSAWVSGPARARHGAAAALIGAALALTEARAAWIAAALSAALLAWRAPARLRIAALLAFCVALVALLARPGVAGRVASAGALRERVWIWSTSLHALAERPVAGWGVSSFRTVYLAAQRRAHERGASFSHYTEYAHLEPLHFAVELGLVGLGLWLWGIAAAFRLWRGSPLRERAPAVWAAAGAGGAALLADAVFSWPWHVAPAIAPAWIMVGACGTGVAAAKPWRARLPRMAVWFLVLLLGGRLAYVSGAMRLGQALASQGRLAEAGAVYSRADLLHPGDVRLCWYEAAAARGRGDPAAAWAAVERAVGLEPDFYEVRLEQAAVAGVLRDEPGAEAALRRAVAIQPGNARGWNNLGNLLGRQGRLLEAEAAQRRAVELDPAMPEARRNLAITLLRLGRRAEARKLMEADGAPAGRSLP